MMSTTRNSSITIGGWKGADAPPSFLCAAVQGFTRLYSLRLLAFVFAGVAPRDLSPSGQEKSLAAPALRLGDLQAVILSGFAQLHFPAVLSNGRNDDPANFLQEGS